MRVEPPQRERQRSRVHLLRLPFDTSGRASVLPMATPDAFWRKRTDRQQQEDSLNFQALCLRATEDVAPIKRS